MPYWSLFYHLVWATKQRRPLLKNETVEIIYRLICSKAEGLGATVITLNGIEDHVHMIASIPPKIAVADLIGKVKGVASSKFNRAGYMETRFCWQSEYGAFSFDRKRLPSFLAYVQRQEEHHRAGSVIPILERTEGIISTRVREPSECYAAESDVWRREMLALGEVWSSTP